VTQTDKGEDIMISDSTRKQIEEMRDHLNAALSIAKELNAPPDAIIQLWSAAGAITNLAAYEDVAKIRTYLINELACWKGCGYQHLS
jgi:hypothetical protein